MVAFTTILLLLFPTEIISVELPEIFLALGWKRINLVHNGHTEMVKLVKTLNQYDVAAKWCKNGCIQNDIPIAIITNNEFELAGDIISERQSESSILITNK